MAPRDAIDLVLLGCSLLLLDYQTRRGRRPAEFLCLAAAILATLALVGYCYGLIAYYRTPGFVPMSLPGSIAFIALAAGILLARPDRGGMAFVISDTTGGFLVRLLLPLGLLLPMLLGALRLTGENAGWYSTRLGVGLSLPVLLPYLWQQFGGRRGFCFVPTRSGSGPKKTFGS